MHMLVVRKKKYIKRNIYKEQEHNKNKKSKKRCR
jgi:hypothetical protein